MGSDNTSITVVYLSAYRGKEKKGLNVSAGSIVNYINYIRLFLEPIYLRISRLLEDAFWTCPYKSWRKERFDGPGPSSPKKQSNTFSLCFNKVNGTGEVSKQNVEWWPSSSPASLSSSWNFMNHLIHHHKTDNKVILNASIRHAYNENKGKNPKWAWRQI